LKLMGGVRAVMDFIPLAPTANSINRNAKLLSKGFVCLVGLLDVPPGFGCRSRVSMQTNWHSRLPQISPLMISKSISRARNNGKLFFAMESSGTRHLIAFRGGKK
jgi:hypothetical protein